MKQQTSKGFTLIEVMIALSIMTVLSIMAWQGISAMLQAQKFSRERSAQVSVMQTALAQWGSDLNHVSYGVDYLGDIPAIRYDGSSLIIVRYDAMRADRALIVVAWTKRPDDANADPKAARGSWLRWQSAAITTSTDLRAAYTQAQAWASAAADTELRGAELNIMPIARWEVQGYQDGGWVSDMTIPTSNNQNSVDALRLILQPAEGGLFAGEITRDWLRPTLAGGGS